MMALINATVVMAIIIALAQIVTVIVTIKK